MSDMKLVVLVLVACALTVGMIHFRQLCGDARRREAARGAWQERRDVEKRAKREAAVIREVESCFPFAAKAVRERLQTGEKPAEAMRKALEEIPGVLIGKTRRGGLPVLIPTASRPTHLAAFGRTGSGKSTLALNLFHADARADHGLVVVTAETEFARDHVLPRIPIERDTVYVAFTDPRCPILWSLFELEPGDLPERASGEFFAAFKRSLRAESLGPRTDAIARNAFAALIGLPGTTLLSIRQLLEDPVFRAEVIAKLKDENCRLFWSRYDEYPAAARLPILGRIESFTSNPALRRTLCSPKSTWSLREALANKKVIVFDLGGLPPDDVMLLGQLILAKLQLEIMHRESVPESERPLTLVYLDEFHEFSAGGEGTFRQLFSKGRRYRVSINAFTQHPNQLSRSLQDEIFGNAATLVCLAVGAKDAARLKRELLVVGSDGIRVPVDADVLQTQAVGQAVVRLGTGSCAVPVILNPPLPPVPLEYRARVKEKSWSKYGAVLVENLTTGVLIPSKSSDGISIHHGVDRPLPGRGGRQHKILQHLIQRWGEAAGFKAVIEQTIFGDEEMGRVDVALERGDRRIAIEIVVTSTPMQALGTVAKSLAAGFSEVIVVSSDARLLSRLEKGVRGGISVSERRRVQFLSPVETRAYLQGLKGPADGTDRSAGYRVTVSYGPSSQADMAERRRVIARLVGTALLGSGRTAP